jgi:hypothetical protein
MCLVGGLIGMGWSYPQNYVFRTEAQGMEPSPMRNIHRTRDSRRVRPTKMSGQTSPRLTPSRPSSSVGTRAVLQRG